MAVQKRRLDWTAIKNALRICGMEIHRTESGPFPEAPASRHYLCNKGYKMGYGSRSNWSVFIATSETQDTKLLIEQILSLSRSK